MSYLKMEEARVDYALGLKRNALDNDGRILPGLVSQTARIGGTLYGYQMEHMGEFLTLMGTTLSKGGWRTLESMAEVWVEELKTQAEEDLAALKEARAQKRKEMDQARYQTALEEVMNDKT